MAENKKVPAAATEEISARLKAATGSIDQLNSDAKTRKNGQKKSSSAKEDARNAKAAEKQRKIEEQRAAALEKARRDDAERAEAEIKQQKRELRRIENERRIAREEAEAAAREARELAVADLLEKERKEAEERSARAAALLDRVVKQVRNDQPTQSSEADDEKTDNLHFEVVDERAQATESDLNMTIDIGDEGEREPATPSDGVFSDVDDGRIILNISDEAIADDGRMLLNISADGAVITQHTPVYAPQGTAGTSASLGTPEDSEDVANEESEIIASTANERVYEEIVDGDSFGDEITASDPTVAAIKMLGRSVYTKSAFAKYNNESREAIKEFNKQIKSFEDALSIENISSSSAVSLLVECVKAAAATVEIRCDNLRVATRFAQTKYVALAKTALSSDIERYNRKAAEFAIYTGVQLTRIPAELAERIASSSGIEVIPALSYSERYIEFNEPVVKGHPTAYVLNLPAEADAEPTLSTKYSEEEVKEPPLTYTIKPIYPVITAEQLIHGIHVTDDATYKEYCRVAEKADKALIDEISKLRAGIIKAEEENARYERKLNRSRMRFESMLMNMRHGIDHIARRPDKNIPTLERARDRCDEIEEKIALNREYIEAESKNADILVECFALERERLLVAFNTMAAATQTRIKRHIAKAKAALIDAMTRYNKRAEECSLVIGISIAPVTISLVDDVIDGKHRVDLPRMARLSELVETVGDSKRVFGRNDEDEAKKPRATCTSLVVNFQPPEESERKPAGASHGYFFVGDPPGGFDDSGRLAANIARNLAATIPMASSFSPVATAASIAMADDDAPLAPITDYNPRMVRKSIYGDGMVWEEEVPYRESLANDMQGDTEFDPIDGTINIGEDIDLPSARSPISRKEKYGEDVSAPVVRESAGESYDSADDSKKKLKLRLVPVKEESESEVGSEASANEVQPLNFGETERMGTPMGEYDAFDDYANRAPGTIPEVIEVDDHAEDTENELLTYPTRKGLRKHISFVTKRIKKASRLRKKLVDKNRLESNPAIMVRNLVEILGVQKEIIDWYCNLVYTCHDLDKKMQARKFAALLKIELKKYNKFVKEYERITEDGLTHASMDIPRAILKGESYQILPKVKLREFEAPEDGIAYSDGITESPDYLPEFNDKEVVSQKDLQRLLSTSGRDISRLRAKLGAKVRSKHSARGTDKIVYTAQCFILQKKIIDLEATNLRAACQVVSAHDIQVIKRALVNDIKQYNDLVSEYKAVSGNALTRASIKIPQDIINGKYYTPVPRVGCIYLDGDDSLAGELREISRDSLLKEDPQARAVLEKRITSQSNKDLTYITKRADYEVSMLESERDMLAYRFGKVPSDVKREKRDIGKRIDRIRRSHKEALKYESSDNKRYYAVVSANPVNMNLKNKKADRERVAAIRSRIISLLNERDIINGKLMALYDGSDINSEGASNNQKWRKIKNKAAAKAKKKQKDLARAVDSLPLAPSEKTKFYNLMNKKVDAESTLALTKHRLRKEKLHEEDKKCAKRDIVEIKAKIKNLDKDINDLMKSTKEHINNIEYGNDWYGKMVLIIVVWAILLALAYYFIKMYLG